MNVFCVGGLKKLFVESKISNHDVTKNFKNKNFFYKDPFWLYTRSFFFNPHSWVKFSDTNSVKSRRARDTRVWLFIQSACILVQHNWTLEI